MENTNIAAKSAKGFKYAPMTGKNINAKSAKEVNYALMTDKILLQRV